MKNENVANAITNGNIETIIQKIKGMPTYEIYESAVKKEKESAKILQMFTLMHSMSDEELSVMMMSVSFDFMFAMIDQKLRNEILNDGE